MQILVSCMSDKATQDSFFTPKAKEALSTLGDVRYGTFTRDGLRDALSGVDVLFGGWGMPQLNEELLSHADRLKLVCYTGGSVADQMTEVLPMRGIHMCSGNRLYAASVAEGTIGYILLAQRRLFRLIEETRDHGWAPFWRSDGIRYKTVGIIGFGMIAKELIRLLSVFGCRILVSSDWYREEDRAVYSAEKCDLATLFRESDIVTLHESLTEATWHSIDRRYFAMMKPDSLFVNTARGSIIVEEDLAEFARSGHIRAVLDVYETEPLPMDSCLRGCENILLVPHPGGPTMDIREQVTLALINDLRRYQAGEKLEHEILWDYAKNMTHSKATLQK